ncbi:MAG: universal stress protein [Armatimonadota bacterium]
MWRIVLATDGSEASQATVELLRALRFPVTTAVRVVTVHAPLERALPWEHPAIDRLEREKLSAARQIADETAEAVRALGCDASTDVRTGEPAREILNAANEHEASLIVVGSRGLSGLQRLILGSVARNVASHAPCAVAIAHPPAHGLRQVVLATDGSEYADRATGFLTRLPLPEDARVTTVGVTRPHNLTPGLMTINERDLEEALAEADDRQRREALRRAEQAAYRLKAAGLASQAELRVGDPTEEILSLAAERHADLIVAGARGVSALEGLFLGSVADRLVNRAPCSVLLVR